MVKSSFFLDKFKKNHYFWHLILTWRENAPWIYINLT